MLNPNTEAHFVIDADKRIVTVPEDLKQIGVALDNNSESILIDLPSSFDGIDWTSDVQFAVKYINADGERDVYNIVDTVSLSDTFSIVWKIDNKVTRSAGNVKFSVVVSNEDGYYWSTIPATVTVAEGITDGESIESIDISTASALISQVQALSELCSNITEEFEALKTSFNTLQELCNSYVYNISENTSAINGFKNTLNVFDTRIADLENKHDNLKNTVDKCKTDILTNAGEIEYLKAIITQ